MNVEKILVEEFEFLENEGIVGINVELEDEPITEGEFIYDGRNCAILVRNNKKAYLFTNIVKEARQKLFSSEEIMMIESKGEEIINSYMVSVTKVPLLPYEDTMTDTLREILEDIKEVYGQEGVERIASEVWGIK